MFTDYILDDNPRMSSGDILRLSAKLLNGYKMDLFVLQLSFMGWHILVLFTFVLLVWIIPYKEMTTVKYLTDIKENYKPKEVTYI